MKDGAHTHGPQGGGGLVLAVLAAAVLLGSGTASAVASALVTILIITASVIAAAVLGGIALLVCRTRSERPGAPIPARPVYQLPPEVRPRLEDSSKPAIRPGPSARVPPASDFAAGPGNRRVIVERVSPGREVHLHFHVNPDQLAAIMRHHTGEEMNHDA